jgi:hypothetical protein
VLDKSSAGLGSVSAGFSSIAGISSGSLSGTIGGGSGFSAATGGLSEGFAMVFGSGCLAGAGSLPMAGRFGAGCGCLAAGCDSFIITSPQQDVAAQGDISQGDPHGEQHALQHGGSGSWQPQFIQCAAQAGLTVSAVTNKPISVKRKMHCMRFFSLRTVIEACRT